MHSELRLSMRILSISSMFMPSLRYIYQNMLQKNHAAGLVPPHGS